MGVKLTSQVPWEMGAEWQTAIALGTDHLQVNLTYELLSFVDASQPYLRGYVRV